MEHVHGHLGWLAVFILAHPAIVLRRRGRLAHVAVLLAVGFATTVSVIGAVLYPSYREAIKPSLFRNAPSVGLMFESKEHLAFAALVLAWVGAIAYFASPRAGALRERLHAFAHRAFVMASALAAIVAALGTWVAIHKTF